MFKKTTRGVSLFLAMLILLSTPAFALETYASSRIDRCSARAKAGTDGNFWVYFSVTASSTMDDIGASKIVIQRYTGSRWVTEATLTPADVPEMETTDAIRHSASISYAPKYSGYSYQAVVTVYASDSSGISSTNVTSMQVEM